MDISSSLAAKMATSKNLSIESPDEVNTSNSAPNSVTNEVQPDKVTLSPEAFEKLRQDTKQSTTGAEKSTDKQQELIEDIKEKIKELEQELKRLRNDKSEQSLEQQKNIQHQIAALNATLLELIGKQLNAV